MLYLQFEKEKSGSLPLDQCTEKKGLSMKKIFVKNEHGYDKTSTFDSKKILASLKRRKRGRKVPTSVALDPELVSKIKEAGEGCGLPYQVLLRMFIIEGFKKWKKAA